VAINDHKLPHYRTFNKAGIIITFVIVKCHYSLDLNSNAIGARR